MNKKTILLILFLIPMNGLLSAKSFVAKKKKTPSISTLKNNCCDSCTDLLQTSAQLIESIAASHISSDNKNSSALMEAIKDLAIVQQLMLAKIRSIIEGSNDCFFAQATKIELLECDDQTKTCHQELVDLHKKIKKNGYTSSEIKSADDNICRYIEYIKAL